MPYEQEFSLLYDTFQKSHVNLARISVSDFYAIEEIHPLLGAREEPDTPPKKLFQNDLAPYTMYKQTDAYHRAWVYLLLPEREVQEVLLMGPYRASPISEEELLEMKNYDYIVVNNSVEESAEQIRNILNSEGLKTKNMINMVEKELKL